MEVTCVDYIKEHITLVQKESEVKPLSIEQATNKYLDAINDRQIKISKLTELTENLAELLYEHFPCLDETAFMEFKEPLRLLLSSLNRSLGIIRQSSYYPGLKAVTKEFRYSIDNLTEMFTDLEMFKDTLPKDKEYISLIKLAGTV